MSEELGGGRNGTGESKFSSFCYQGLRLLLNVLEEREPEEEEEEEGMGRERCDISKREGREGER